MILENSGKFWKIFCFLLKFLLKKCYKDRFTYKIYNMTYFYVGVEASILRAPGCVQGPISTRGDFSRQKQPAVTGNPASGFCVTGASTVADYDPYCHDQNGPQRLAL